jgi:PAS domain S-box-containing protein
VAQQTKRAAITPAGILPPASLIAVATIATAWPAAGFGALVISAAGDFAATDTLWIFGWPFLTALLGATTLHLLAVGFGARLGIPAAFPEIHAFDDALARADIGTCDEQTLRAALHAAVRFPVWNETVGLALSGLVVATTAAVEEAAAGPGSPNVFVILRGGLYATALYGAASLALAELLTRPACRTLRRAAVGAGIEPYRGYVLGRGWRIATMVVPMVVALGVAVEIGHSHGGALAYAELIGLSALVAIALNWLQYENGRSAVRELRDACRDLAAGHEGGLITGSIEPMLLEMANEFTAAARRVGVHRRDSGERYRAVFEAALDAIITIDHQARIVEFNPAAERMFGCPRAAAVGHSAIDIVLPPELRPAHAEAFAHFMATGEAGLLGRRMEIRAMRGDGGEFLAEVAVSRIRRDGPPMFTLHMRDITARKQAEEALTASKREMEEQAEIAAALLRVGETISAHVGRPDLLEQVSRLTAEALGCDAASIYVRIRSGDAFILGTNVGSPPEIVAEVRQIEFTPQAFPVIAELRPGKLVELPDVAHSIFPAALARRWRLASLLLAPITRGDEMVGFIVAMDRERVGPFTAKQRRLALGIAHTTAIALENARLITDLQAASRMKTEFVSTMSHELRTPLNVILGFCEMARDPEADHAARELCHERIEMAGRTLLEMIESTLEVGKLEAGREDLELEPVELPAFWEKLGREYAVRPRSGDVVLEWSARVPDVVVLTDARKLAMVVRNLVSNALKFTESGFVRVEVLHEPEELVLRVADTGIGIEPADQEKIFEMFCQGDGSDSRRHGGTGLGLYIVRRVVEQLGGRVDLESAVGWGSIFSVRLPYSGTGWDGQVSAAGTRGPTSGNTQRSGREGGAKRTAGNARA